MSFRPEAIRGGRSTARESRGQVDYRLARNAIISEFRKGRLGRPDVCDAHPELVRAARQVGHRTTEECPICEQADVVLVSYVFGPRLPAHGRCITSRKELATFARKATVNTCYVVEVCPECSWNHLARIFTLGGPPATSS
ncbi:MAG: DUF5318 family protein [Actinobacteria bacterium]|nr:DUF5318 family protein [Actinomycetota bacterium]